MNEAELGRVMNVAGACWPRARELNNPAVQDQWRKAMSSLSEHDVLEVIESLVAKRSTMPHLSDLVQSARRLEAERARAAAPLPTPPPADLIAETPDARALQWDRQAEAARAEARAETLTYCQTHNLTPEETAQRLAAVDHEGPAEQRARRRFIHSGNPLDPSIDAAAGRQPGDLQAEAVAIADSWEAGTFSGDPKSLEPALGRAVRAELLARREAKKRAHSHA